MYVCVYDMMLCASVLEMFDVYLRGTTLRAVSLEVYRPAISPDFTPTELVESSRLSSASDVRAREAWRNW